MIYFVELSERAKELEDFVVLEAPVRTVLRVERRVDAKNGIVEPSSELLLDAACIVRAAIVGTFLELKDELVHILGQDSMITYHSQPGQHLTILSGIDKLSKGHVVLEEDVE